MRYNQVQLSLFWFASVFLLALECARVDASSSFVPFSTNKWGTGTSGPSAAPTTIPSSHKRAKKVKKGGSKTKHVSKKKRKSKSHGVARQSTPVAFVNTEMRKQKDNLTIKRKKKRRKKIKTTQSGLPSIAKKTKKGIKKKTKKKSKIRGDETFSRESNILKGQPVSSKTKSSKKRKMRKEASKSIVMPDVGAQSAGKAPKKKKRIKKIRKNALEVEVGSRNTHMAAPEKKKVKKRKVKKVSDPDKKIIPVVEEIKKPEIVTPSLLEKAEVNTDSAVVAAEEEEDHRNQMEVIDQENNQKYENEEPEEDEQVPSKEVNTVEIGTEDTSIETNASSESVGNDSFSTQDEVPETGSVELRTSLEEPIAVIEADYDESFKPEEDTTVEDTVCVEESKGVEEPTKAVVEEPSPTNDTLTQESESDVSIEVNVDKHQNVVEFIEDVLQEDVKSWVNESSTESDVGPSDTLNETRGGHLDGVDDDNDAIHDQEEVIDETKTSTDEEETEQVNEANESPEKASVDKFQEISTKDPDVESPESVDKDTPIENDDRELPIEATKIEEPALDISSLESSEDSKSDIAVSVVSWNLAELSPSEDDATFIRKFRKSGIKSGTGSDLVLISGQECENIKPRRSEGRRSREYRRLMIKMLGKQYVPIVLHLLGGIQFGLFAKKSFLKEIEDVSVADVTCGIGNVFHNKGAIAAFVKVKARNPAEGNKAKSLRMVFVTAHLAAHVKNSDARDSDFWRISSELESQAPEGFLPKKTSEDDPTTSSFLFSNVDRVFFCGDLNYRLDLPRELTEYTITKGSKSVGYEDLMRHDQLKRSIAEGRAFTGFVEGKIAFAPTFKFDKETGSYDTSHKQRIPAWTDRILFKPDGTRVLEYTSVPDAQHSDHRPVHGTFRVSMEGRDLPARKRTRKKKQQRSKRDRSDY